MDKFTFSQEEIIANNNNKEYMLKAVSNYGYALEYASAKLRADREIVLTALSTWGSMLKYA